MFDGTNLAGQVAIYFSKFPSIAVEMLVRGEEVPKRMSIVAIA